jgi:hypothetical protein
VELLAAQVALQSQTSAMSRQVSVSESLMVSVQLAFLCSNLDTSTAQRRRTGRMSRLSVAPLSAVSSSWPEATPAELAEAVRVLSAWNPTQDDTLNAQVWIQWIDSVNFDQPLALVAIGVLMHLVRNYGMQILMTRPTCHCCIKCVDCAAQLAGCLRRTSCNRARLRY